MRTGLLVLLMMSLFAPCFGAEADKPQEPAKSEAPAAKTAEPAAAPAKPAPKEVPAAKPAVAPAKPAAPAKPKESTRTEAEISGLTSETNDQLYTRFNIAHTGGVKSWWFRAGYGMSKTRTYSGTKVNETSIDTYSLNAQYRIDEKQRYKFVSATVNVRDRDPYTVTYGDRSGYYMISAGVGRTIMPGFESELALANVTQYDHGKDSRVTLVSSLRLKKGLTEAMMLDADANLVQPFADDMLVDSRMNLTYKLSPNVSLRFTYIANNLLTPVTTKSGWDKSLRISLVFGRTTY